MVKRYWTPEECALLRAKYRYDPTTGRVARVVPEWQSWPDPIGSMNGSGQLVATIPLNGVQTIVRVTKLAYLLATGKQVHKFAWKDRDRTNNRLDNLIPLGEEIVDVQEAKRADAERHLAKVELQLAKKEGRARASDASEVEEIARIAKDLRARLGGVRAERPLVRATDVGVQETVEARRSAQPIDLGYTHTPSTQNPDWVAWARLRVELRRQQWLENPLYGLYTGCSVTYMKEFWASSPHFAKGALGFGIEFDTVMVGWSEQEKLTRIAGLSKRDNDYVICARYLIWLDRGSVTEKEVNAHLAAYQWKDEPFYFPMELSPAYAAQLGPEPAQELSESPSQASPVEPARLF